MPHGTGNDKNTTQVVDFGEARAQKLDDKRRKAERIFFRHLLGVYCVTGNDQMRPIELVDVSEDGCAFQVPFDANKPWPTDAEKAVPMRLYFTQDTYIPIQVKIENSRPCLENGARYVRFGCSVDKEMSSYPAYSQFVKFLKLFSEHSHKDKGDVTVFYL